MVGTDVGKLTQVTNARLDAERSSSPRHPLHAKHTRHTIMAHPATAASHPPGFPVPHTPYALDALMHSKGTALASAVFAVRSSRLVAKVLPRAAVGAGLWHEARLQAVAARAGVAPAVHALTFTADYAYLIMDRVDGMSVADTFGDAESKAPEFETSEEGRPVAEGVRDALRRLAAAGIVYRDRTPYNFILTDDGGVMVIDFEHAEAVEGAGHVGDPGGGPLWDADFF